MRRNQFACFPSRVSATVIRPADPAEVDQLPGLEVDSYARYVEVSMEAVATADQPSIGDLRSALEEGLLLVAECDLQVVGFMTCRVVDNTMYVAAVNVRPRFAHRAIGANLLVAAEQLARDRDLERMSLTTFADVPWNGPYYSRLGWTVLPDAQMPEGLAVIRARQRDAGFEQWPRQTMVKKLESRNAGP